MKPVFDAPVGPGTSGGGLGPAHRHAAAVEPLLALGLVAALGDALDSHQGFQSGPAEQNVFREVANPIQNGHPPKFRPPMGLLLGFRKEVGKCGWLCAEVSETGLEGLEQPLLVRLHSQDVVRLPSHDLFHNGLLTAHRIDGDDATPEIQDLQKLWNNLDLIALQERLAKGTRGEKSEDAIEGVVTGNAVGQGQEGTQPALLPLGEVHGALPVIDATERGQHGDDEDVEQDVSPPLHLPGIGQSPQMACKTLELRSHGGSLHGNVLAQFDMKYKCLYSTFSREPFCAKRSTWATREAQSYHAFTLHVWP